VEARGYACRDRGQDYLVGGDRILQELGDAMPGRLEACAPVGVDEVGIEREVELDVAASGRDGIGDELALDCDCMLDEVVVGRVRIG
jgi:hypothetical protein